MFNIFRKKTEKEKLIKLYNQKKKKAFELSRINRIESDKLEKEAFDILKKLNGKKHNLVSSVCISKNGSMIWNYTEKATLTMRNFSDDNLKDYLSKISDFSLYSYNVYQIEGEGKNLFLKIEGDKDTIMGLPIKKIKKYLENYK